MHHSVAALPENKFPFFFRLVFHLFLWFSLQRMRRELGVSLERLVDPAVYDAGTKLRSIFQRVRMRPCPRGPGYTASFANGGCFGRSSLKRVGVPDPPRISVANDVAGRSQLARLVWLYLERAPAEERLRAWDTVFLAETYPVNAQFYDLREDERVRSMDEIWETMEAVQAGTNRSVIEIIASMDES